MKNLSRLARRQQQAAKGTGGSCHLEPHATLGSTPVDGVAVQQGELVAAQRHLVLAAIGVGDLDFELTAVAASEDAADGSVADALALALVDDFLHLGDRDVLPAGSFELVDQVDRWIATGPDDVRPGADFASVAEVANDRPLLVQLPSWGCWCRCPSWHTFSSRRYRVQNTIL